MLTIGYSLVRRRAGRASLMVPYTLLTLIGSVVAFAAMGISAPPFQVTSVEDDPFGDPRVCRRVRGTFQVPL